MGVGGGGNRSIYPLEIFGRNSKLEGKKINISIKN
jgi:hypothetical protein